MAADDLLAAFNIGLSVAKEENSTDSQHPRLDEYKGRYVRLGDQSNRRKEFLERQKKKKFDAANYARKLADGDLNEDEYNEVNMEVVHEKDSPEPGKHKRFNPYKNQLMLSEWVVDPPDDLAESWTMVLCPVGKRVLVVANKGQTKVYSKSGYLLHQQFGSLLPGGCYSLKRNSKGSSILDCIFDEVNQIFWILDLMCFKGHPIYDCDTDFRFFWLNTKLIEDSPGINEISRQNKFKFLPCINVPCSKDSIADTLTDMHPFQIDGVLFYHKLSHYNPGRTPLVGWLKPYMIPEILGLPMPLAVMEGAPVEFNRTILKAENDKLQETTSDKSFVDPNNKTQNVNEIITTIKKDLENQGSLNGMET